MNFKYEKDKIRKGYQYVIGSDEVGRGSLAGPVVAAAVVLPLQVESEKWKVIKSCGIKDSKLLLPQKRQELDLVIKDNAIAWSIAEVSSEIVDEINIHNASLLAMKKAVEKLLCYPGLRPGIQKIDSRFRGNDRFFLFLDGRFEIPGCECDQQAVVAGDDKVLCVAAASIIAKVYRDNLMRKLHQTYPIYNFAQHKGYATKYHRKTILQAGLSPVHRQSFCEHLT